MSEYNPLEFFNKDILNYGELERMAGQIEMTVDQLKKLKGNTISAEINLTKTIEANETRSNSNLIENQIDANITEIECRGLIAAYEQSREELLSNLQEFKRKIHDFKMNAPYVLRELVKDKIYGWKVYIRLTCEAFSK